MICKATFTSLFLSILFIFSTCKDDNKPTPVIEDPMPPYTETGANTFGFKVNGKTVVAHDYLNPDNADGIIAFRVKSTIPNEGYIFNCEATLVKKNHYEAVFLRLSNVSDTGIYQLRLRSPELPHQGQYRIGKGVNQNKVYVTTDDYIGLVHVTKFDSVNKIISGRFQFSGEYFFGTDTVNVTDGQFDIKYIQTH